MAILIQCPGCAAQYRVPLNLRGKRVKCKKCDGPILIPYDPAGVPEIEINLKPDEPVVQVKPVPEHAVKILGSRDSSQLDFESVAPAVVYSAPVRQTVARPRHERQYDRKPVRASTAAPEGFSSLLLGVYVLLQFVYALCVSCQSGTVGVRVWGVTAGEVITFFVITAPVIWASLVLSSKIMRFELAEPAYIKGAALAISPGMLVLLDLVLPLTPVLKITGLICVLPFTYILTSLLFSLRTDECIVTYLLGAVGCLIGWFLKGFVLWMIVLSNIPDQQLQARMIAAGNFKPYFTEAPAAPPIAQGDSPAVPPQISTPDSIYRPAPPTDSVVSQLNQLETQARNMTRPDWMNNQSREQLTNELNSLQNQAEAVRLQCTTSERKDKFQELAGALQAAGPQIAVLSSESPDDSIYQPINDTTIWAPSPGDPTAPASFRNYRMEMPTDAKVDLRSVEDSPEGLTWDLPHGRLTITIAPRPTPRQQRPWVMTHSFQKPGGADIFSISAVNIPVDISFAQIGISPATRIATKPAENGNRLAQRWVKYVIANGKEWLVVTCTADESDARTLSTLENCAWSIHPARSDEPRVDPFNVDAMVARITEDRAAEIIRRMGPAAEPALLKRLDDPDPQVDAKVIELLGEIGTKKSVPALLALAQTDDRSNTDLARKALRKISPGSMDDVAEAMIDLGSKDMSRRKKAIGLLAATPPKADDNRRSKVALALTGLILDHSESFGLDAGPLGDAVANWQTQATVPVLLPLLDHDTSIFQRQLAMTVLAKTKDKRAVFPIIRWVIEDTDHTTQSLIGMGAVAEDETIKLLSNKNPIARCAACTVLGEIGGKKSLKPLDNLVFYKEGPKDVDAGNAAIALIKERLTNPTAPAPTAPAGGKADDQTPNLFPNAR